VGLAVVNLSYSGPSLY